MIEYWDTTIDGELTENNLRRKLEIQGYSVHKYVYPPGTRFPEHTHDVDKIDAVVSGSFRLTVEDQSFILEAGDCLAVPAHVSHCAEVVGEEPVVSLDAVLRRTPPHPEPKHQK